MRSVIASFTLLLVLVGAWLGLALVSDGERATAIALHAEPLIWMVALGGIYLLLTRRRYATALALAASTALGAGLLRMPALPVVGAAAQGQASLGGRAPAWFGPVRKCAGAVEAPSVPVRVLSWTVDPSVDDATIEALLLVTRPDVAVLSRLTDGEVLARVAERLGGEHTLLADAEGAPGVGLYTRSQFPLCGPASSWAEESAPGAGYVLTFVQVGEEQHFPLLAVHLPSPVGGGSWKGRHVWPAERVGDALDVLASAAAVVVGDVSATSTYRWLDDRLAHHGVNPIGDAPNWPAHVLGMRVPPLQPADRVWTGAAWSAASAVLDTPVGDHAPVLVTLAPARHTARYQLPVSPILPGPT